MKKPNSKFKSLQGLIPSTKQRTVTYGLLFIIISTLLTYFILLVSHFFDTSMKERLHNYFSSREGLVVVRLYIVLVVGTILLTFWEQVKKIMKKLKLH